KFGILPAVVEGEQRRRRGLPELRRCLRQDWRDYKNRHGADLANLRGGSAIGPVRGGIEKFRPRLGNFLRELLPKNRSAFCRHGIAGQPVSVVVRAEFRVRFKKTLAIMGGEKIRASAHVRELFSEERE